MRWYVPPLPVAEQLVWVCNGLTRTAHAGLPRILAVATKYTLSLELQKGGEVRYLFRLFMIGESGCIYLTRQLRLV